MFKKKLSILLLAVVMVLSISSSAFAQSVQPSNDVQFEPDKRWASVEKGYYHDNYPSEIYYDDGNGYTGTLEAKRSVCFYDQETGKATSCSVTYEGYLYYTY